MLISRSELASLPSLDWLIDGVVPARSLGVLWGSPASMKSFAALHMACSVATGRKWMGCETKQGSVLYVAAEGELDLNHRIVAWEKTWGKGETIPDAQLKIHIGSLGISHEEEIIDLQQRLNDYGTRPGLVVIDTLSRCLRGGDENQASTIEALVSNLEHFGRGGATILLIHHGAKHTNEARGSIALKGAVDFEYEMRREQGSSACTMFCRKMKAAREPEPVYLITEPHLNSLVMRRSGSQ